ncbi:MAG: ATP-dependent DNA helicase RecG [Holophagae bacterium]
MDTLRGIGPKTAARLAEVGVWRVVDLLLLLPRRYEDRGAVVPVSVALTTASPVLLRGRLTCTGGRYARRRLHIAEGVLVDGTGSLPVRWFNQPWQVERLAHGVEALVYGVVRPTRGGRFQIVNPEVTAVGEGVEPDDLVPVYPRVAGLGGRRLVAALGQALGCLEALSDPLPERVRRELGLPGLAAALSALHRPPGRGAAETRQAFVAALNERCSSPHQRLAFDELLALAAVVEGCRVDRLERTTRPIRPTAPPGERAREVLPFELTGAQRRVVGEIARDLGRTVPMARLLQGDVGSGKTAVAALTVLAAVDSDRQAAVMAPTELLAEQLHRELAAVLGRAGRFVDRLTGSTPAGDARSVRERLATGELGVVVGTHALFQQGVAFADLGLVVIDEQHRFGVTQRQRLLDKGEAPHLLVMTATPIPRTLALTFYGDLDLSVIDELPPGRQPVRTVLRGPDARGRVLRFVRSEVADGGQAYIVYPRIEASDDDAVAALEAHEAAVRDALGVPVGVLHGRLDRTEQEAVADAFRRGELPVLLATTVIEVGVDVPAASVMVIESAERFGLSQLHQLRGRVGRGNRRSWCVLITSDEVGGAAERRLRVLELTDDGFEIAEADLRHRGPGELTGVRQWGADDLRFADLVRDHRLAARARSVARDLAGRGELDEVRRKLLDLHPVGDRVAVG